MAEHLLSLPIRLPPPAVLAETPPAPVVRFLLGYDDDTSSEAEEYPEKVVDRQRVPFIVMSMASSSSRPEKVYHQDYIARIRYSNALPPPPGDPKLLNIPCDGLEYYTSAAFASRMARTQPLNIEPDGDLGMKVDAVGMPGIFDGDESSIQAPMVPPPIHPKDASLLRKLPELGKPKFAPGGVSFLRRTEYISSEQPRTRVDSAASRNPAKPTIKKRKPVDAAKDEPISVLRSVVKSFDIANPEDAYTGPDTEENVRGAAPTPAELEAWSHPKHPSKPELKLLDAYPIMPDLDAVTDTGGYMVAKFASNPTHATEARDTRMDASMVSIIPASPAAEAEYQAKLSAHEADPAHVPHPGPLAYSYNLFLPADVATADKMKKKFDVDDPQKDDPTLYNKKNKDGEGVFNLDSLRVYETGRQTMSRDNYQEVAIAFHDRESDEAGGDGEEPERLEKAAYYYPIFSKMQLKPRRNRNLANIGTQFNTNLDEEVDKVDKLSLTIRDPNEIEQAKRAALRKDMEHAG